MAAETVISGGGSDENWGHLNTFLTDTVQNDRTAVGKVARRSLRSRMKEGNVVLGPKQPEMPAPDGAETLLPNIVVLASGNLGLLYSTDSRQRVTLEQIENKYPGLLQGLAGHEGIGFVMVHSQEQGGVVIGRGGRYYLDDDRIEGENPLEPFGPNAARHLRRNDGFSNAPDIYINSFFNADTNEVTAFEELIGCHGGLGGYQTQPFLLYPVEWELESEPMIGAATVHRQLKQVMSR